MSEEILSRRTSLLTDAQLQALAGNRRLHKDLRKTVEEEMILRGLELPAASPARRPEIPLNLYGKAFFSSILVLSVLGVLYLTRRYQKYWAPYGHPSHALYWFTISLGIVFYSIIGFAAFVLWKHYVG